jgi:hypothetical protein
MLTPAPISKVAALVRGCLMVILIMRMWLAQPILPVPPPAIFGV